MPKVKLPQNSSPTGLQRGRSNVVPRAAHPTRPDRIRIARLDSATPTSSPPRARARHGGSGPENPLHTVDRLHLTEGLTTRGLAENQVAVAKA